MAFMGADCKCPFAPPPEPAKCVNILHYYHVIIDTSGPLSARRAVD